MPIPSSFQPQILQTIITAPQLLCLPWFLGGFSQPHSSESKMEVLVTQSGQTPWVPVDCSLPGLSVNGNLRARILEWASVPFFRGSSWPRDQTPVSCTAGRVFTAWAVKKALHSSNPTGLLFLKTYSPAFFSIVLWNQTEVGKSFPPLGVVLPRCPQSLPPHPAPVPASSLFSPLCMPFSISTECLHF